MVVICLDERAWAPSHDATDVDSNFANPKPIGAETIYCAIGGSSGGICKMDVTAVVVSLSHRSDASAESVGLTPRIA